MGLISSVFDSYGKWGASKFTDLFNLEFVNATKTDGLMWHLQEIRQKTYDAILALEAGVTANDSKISNNLGRIEANSNSLQNHETRIGNVEAGVTANDAKITNNLTKIESLNSSLHFITQKEVEIDLTNLSENRTYPVAISAHPRICGMIEFEIKNVLRNTSHPSWATHSEGFTLYVKGEFLGSGWGAVTSFLNIKHEAQMFNSKTIKTQHFEHIETASIIFYLRGGGRYYFLVPELVNVIGGLETIDLGSGFIYSYRDE